NRLFDKTVFVLPDGLSKVFGTKSRRSSAYNYVSERNCFFICIESQEFAVFGNINFVFKLRRKLFITVCQGIGKNIGQRNNFYILFASQSLKCRSRASSAAAD